MREGWNAIKAAQQTDYCDLNTVGNDGNVINV